MTAAVDVVRRAPAAVFVPVDAFAVQTVPGPPLGLDRTARSPLRFGLLTARFGAAPAAPTTLPPGWWLVAVRTASGSYVSYGDVEGPDQVRRRLLGGPTDVSLSVVSRYYRALPAPLAVRLQNLDPDPSAPAADVAPTVVELRPGVLYPFPVRLTGSGVVRGLVTGPDRRGTDGVTVTATAAASGSTPAFADTCTTEHGGQFVLVVPDAAAATRRLHLAVPGAVVTGVDVPRSGTATATTIVTP